MSGRLPCLGQFYICPKLETDMFSNLMKLGISSKHIFGSYAILTDGRTPIQTAQSSDFSVFVFGYAVNVHTGSADNLAEELISNVKTPKELIEREKKLANTLLYFNFSTTMVVSVMLLLAFRYSIHSRMAKCTVHQVIKYLPIGFN